MCVFVGPLSCLVCLSSIVYLGLAAPAILIAPTTISSRYITPSLLCSVTVYHYTCLSCLSTAYNPRRCAADSKPVDSCHYCRTIAQSSLNTSFCPTGKSHCWKSRRREAHHVTPSSWQ
ncbi:hypothetical protein F4861DRAFT_302385 [Xylaria intraflava]|nr:hypothetical protein F4861DRAFT_302385 [Xylaria intraflava]